LTVPTAVDRRRLLISAAALAALPRAALAGAQIYEPLADAVRTALAAQIAEARPPERRIDDPQQRIAHLGWLGEMSERLKIKIPEFNLRVEFLKTLDYECIRAGLDRQLVLGLIQVESNFRKYAISVVGARGLMQVMPFWTKVIGDGEPRRLFDMRTNLRYGTVILRHYLDIEQGDLYMALGRYNGSRGRREYPEAVHAAWKGRWQYAPSPMDVPTGPSAPRRVG
jgi:soluble lytic murein transglycosylase-like protein